MKFAINYSPQAAELFRDGRIELDYFKTPPWPDMIAEAKQLRPVAVHFNLRAGRNGNPDWGAIEHYLAHTATAYVNIHLAIKASEMPAVPANKPPTPAQKEAVIERLLTSVQKLTAYFGPERVIAENIPFHPNQDYNLLACCQPEVISAVIEQSGCGLLLDISHARIAAHYLGMEAQSYIEALPVEQLRELHFTGIHDLDGHWMDHLAILETDWPWLEWVLGKVNYGAWGTAHLLAFEYGGTGEFFARFSDPEVIAAQVPRLYEMCHNGNSISD